MHAWNLLWKCLSSVYITKKNNLNCKESNFMQAEAPWNADAVTLKILQCCKFSEITEIQERAMLTINISANLIYSTNF